LCSGICCLRKYVFCVSLENDINDHANRAKSKIIEYDLKIIPNTGGQAVVNLRLHI